MKTIIYYFTGTGNSLAAAKKIAGILGGCEIVPISSLMKTEGEIIPDADRIGFVCPVYDAGLPLIVAECAGRINLSKAGYTFGIVTLGGIGVSALHQLNRIVSLRNGRPLDAAFIVKMPGNFPPVGKIATPEKQQEILQSADSRLTEIAGIIDKGLVVRPGFSPLSALMHHLAYGSFAKNGHTMDTAFSVADSCTSCGTCEKVCPVGNVVMENGRPVWQHHCELCCACLHFCPVEAIQLSMMQGTKDRGRYRHPDLKIDEMRAQQSKNSKIQGL